jgi:hypothetical protein
MARLLDLRRTHSVNRLMLLLLDDNAKFRCCGAGLRIVWLGNDWQSSAKI